MELSTYAVSVFQRSDRWCFGPDGFVLHLINIFSMITGFFKFPNMLCVKTTNP